jgi:RNA polymerase sigma factor (sigma-70 family)
VYGEIGRRHMVDASMSEDGLLHRLLLDRDITSMAEIYDQFAPGVFAVALRVTTDRQAAEDVTQETLLDLWRRPERFDPARGCLRPWLATIAHNRSIDWIRHERAARARDLRDLALLHEQVPDIGDGVETVMTAERVRLALSTLPEHERTPIRLAFYGDKSYQQVAEVLQVAEGTIKARIRSGLRHLARTMNAERLS